MSGYEETGALRGPTLEHGAKSPTEEPSPCLRLSVPASAAPHQCLQLVNFNKNTHAHTRTHTHTHTSRVVYLPACLELTEETEQ